MKINTIFTDLLLIIPHSNGYLYHYLKPGYKHRIGKIKRTPELIPSQMPFYTTKETNTNSSS